MKAVLLDKPGPLSNCSVDANDHLLRQLIGVSIFGDLLSNLFVDALSNSHQPGSGVGMGSSTRRWEKHSRRSAALRYESCAPRLTYR
jgi:hypothetical protein